MNCTIDSNGSGMPSSIVTSSNDLVGLQLCLSSANELIVLLEKQRSIYRSLTRSIPHNAEPQLQTQLAILDQQIEQTYKSCDLKRCLLQTGPMGSMGPSRNGWSANLVPSKVTLTTPLLGINMKSLISGSQSNSSDQNGTTESISNSTTNKKWNNKNRTIYKCNQRKCRFSCFSEKSLMKHQLQHRVDQLLTILEPHGYELCSPTSLSGLSSLNVIVKKINKNKDSEEEEVINPIQTCFFPFCNHQFESEVDQNRIISHLNQHLSSWLIYPCFGCMKMFDCREKLVEHHREQEQQQKSSAAGFRCCHSGDNLFDCLDCGLSDNEIDVDPSGGDLKSSSGGQVAAVTLSQCQLCSNRYPTRRLLSLHYRLFHQMVDEEQQDVVPQEEEEEERNNINNSFRCRLCREDFANKKLIEIHSLMFHNIENYKDICGGEEIEVDHRSGSSNLNMITTTIEKCFDDDDNLDPSQHVSIEDHLFEDHHRTDDSQFLECLNSPKLDDHDELGQLSLTTSSNHQDDDEIDLTEQSTVTEDSYRILNEVDMVDGMLMIDPGNEVNGPIHEVVIETSQNNSSLNQLDQTDTGISIEPDSMELESKHATETLTKVISIMNHDNQDQVQYQVLFETLQDHHHQTDQDTTKEKPDVAGGNYVVIDANSVAEFLTTENIGNITSGKDMEEVSTLLHETTTDQDNKGQQSLEPEMSDCMMAPSDDLVKEAGGLSQLMNLYIYECSHCSYSFRSESELALHNYVLHQAASFSCSQCEFVTQDIEIFRRHEPIHRSNVSGDGIGGSGGTSVHHLCTLCQQGFQSDEQLSEHLKNRHTTYQCPFCKITSTNRYTLNSHMLSFHRDSISKCATCNYKTFYADSMTKHQRIHSIYKLCPYDDCQDSFGSDTLLQTHINKFHKMEKPFKCQICGQCFYGARHLNRHLSQQHRSCLFRCDVCSLQCPSARALSVHRKCHTTERPFTCDEPGCLVSFRTVHLLKSHQLNRHPSNGQLVTCDFDQCRRTFKTKTQLRQHHKLHTGNRFICDYAQCGQRFASQAQLNGHRIQLSHLKSLFSCPSTPNCTEVFVKKSELNRHLKECKHRSRITPGSLLDSVPSSSSSGFNSTTTTTIILNSSGNNQVLTTTNQATANRSLAKSLIVLDRSNQNYKNITSAVTRTAASSSQSSLLSGPVGHNSIVSVVTEEQQDVDVDDGQSLITNEIASIVEI